MQTSQLTLVKDQAEHKQKQLSERFEKAAAFVNGERHQLEQLQQYRQDYLDKISASQQSWDAQSSARYRQFCYQLSQAMVSQEQKLSEAEKQLEQMRYQLYQQQQRIQVLDDMIDRQQQELTHLQDSKIQKELDDHNSRQYFYKH